MARRPPRAHPGAKWLAVVLVGVLLIGTAVLVYFALQRGQGSDVEPTTDPVPTFTLGPQQSPSPSPEPTTAPESAAAASPAAARAEERFLAVGSGSIWRATAGDCGAAQPLMERSDNDGGDWIDVTPLYKGIGQVVALDAFAGTEAEAIAVMGDDCETQALRTFTQGEFWESYPDVLEGSRYLDPADPSSVVTPNGPVDAPCATPQSFRAAGTLVAVVCEGTPHRLVNGSWSPLPAQGVVALALDGSELLTAAPAEGCSGVAVTRWSGPSLDQPTELGCAPEAAPTTPMAIAADGDSALVWSADTLTTLGR